MKELAQGFIRTIERAVVVIGDVKTFDADDKSLKSNLLLKKLETNLFETQEINVAGVFINAVLESLVSGIDKMVQIPPILMHQKPLLVN